MYKYPLREEHSIFPRVFGLVHNGANGEIYCAHKCKPAAIPGVVEVKFGLGLIILRKAGARDERFVGRKYPGGMARLPTGEREALMGSKVCGVAPDTAHPKHHTSSGWWPWLIGCAGRLSRENKDG